MAETWLPISFEHLVLPEKSTPGGPPPTALLDLQSLPRWHVGLLHNREFENIYPSTIKSFIKIKTQAFQALYSLVPIGRKRLHQDRRPSINRRYSLRSQSRKGRRAPPGLSSVYNIRAHRCADACRCSRSGCCMRCIMGTPAISHGQSTQPRKREKTQHTQISRTSLWVLVGETPDHPRQCNQGLH